MTLKMNSLLISIVALTIFVTIIPILVFVDDASNKAYATHVKDEISYEDLKRFKQNYNRVDDASNKAYATFVNDEISYKDLNSLTQKYNKEILLFIQIIKLKNNSINQNGIERFMTNEEDIMSVSLLYFKEKFEEFIMYVTDSFINSSFYIQYLLFLKNDTEDAEFKEGLKKYEDILKDVSIHLFEIVTFFSLPKDIEVDYLFKQKKVLYFFYKEMSKFPLVVHNYEVPKKEYPQFVVLYIKELNEFNSTVFPETEIALDNIKYNKESNERKVAVNTYFKSKALHFEKKWKFADKQFNVLFVHYLIHDKIESNNINLDDELLISDNGVEQSMNIVTAFLKYFKESLDKYFELNVHVDIDKITDGNNKNLFYTRMLRTMFIIYKTYSRDKIPTTFNIRDFVKLMIDSAEVILKSNKTKPMDKITTKKKVQDFVKLMFDSAEVILKSNKTKPITVIPLSELIYKDDEKERFVKNYMTKYDEIKCNMPKRADWKSVLKYLIMKTKEKKLFHNIVQ